MPRYAAKIDANQPDLVRQIRGLGASVLHTHTLGCGAQDIVVGFRGINYLFEIKDPNKPQSARKLTPDEEKFHMSWRGSIYIIETIDDVVNIFNSKK